YETSFAKTWVEDYFTKNTGLDKVKPTLISKDMYDKAGAANSYLVNGQYFWTSTPSNTVAWIVNYNGNVGTSYVTNPCGIRPVINVNSELVITGGNDTLTVSKPGILDKVITSVTDKNLSQVGLKAGEYVVFGDKPDKYRVVANEADGVRLVLDGYKESKSYNDIFNTITPDTYVETLVGATNKTKLVKNDWYKGDAFTKTPDYRTVLKYDTNPYNSYVGLLRYGEMLSGQSVSITSKNHYWLNNNYDNSNAWIVLSNGNVGSNGVTYTRGVRPVIKVDYITTITAGNGTLEAPYKI
ncbi:MAG: hypothetical protein RSB71_02620, partial [Bacilli bacterium]